MNYKILGRSILDYALLALMAAILFKWERW
jgi:hypothetical protein